MSWFLSLGTGPKIYIELARWADVRPGLHIARERGELLIWLGRLHLIYTPARWRPPARGPTARGPLDGPGSGTKAYPRLVANSEGATVVRSDARGDRRWAA